jgi:hypothetical protein
MRLLIIIAFSLSCFSVLANSNGIKSEEAWLATAKIMTHVHKELSKIKTEKSYQDFWDKFESTLSDENKLLLNKSGVRDFEMRKVLLKSFEKSLNQGSTNGLWLLVCSFRSVGCFQLEYAIDQFIEILLVVLTLNDSEVTSDI